MDLSGAKTLVIPRCFLVAVGLTALAGSLHAADLSTLRFVLLSRNLAAPTSITHAGDERLFVTLQAGQIVLFENGRLLNPPFLGIDDRVKSTGSELPTRVGYPVKRPALAIGSVLRAGRIPRSSSRSYRRFRPLWRKLWIIS